jgi:photosystem II stability/assembly factor-like uncharacterized protein
MKKLLLLSSFAFGLFTFAFSQEYGWVKIDPASINGTPDFSALFFTDADTGWITTSTTDNIYRTDDGAATFSTQTTPLGATSAIHMLNGNNGYSGGQGGWVYKTSDGGLNWNILATMGSLSDISFPFNTDPNNPIGYACGDAGRVWEITSTLTDLNTGLGGNFNGISAPSVDHVWVCGGNRIYYYNGTDFTSQIAPGGTFNDIHFINDQEGWVVGNSGVIGNTTDGGTTWNTQTNPDPQTLSLYGVFFLDSDRGWAVGLAGLILQTTDGGTTWTIEEAGLTTAFLRGVHFTSATNGYVVGNEKTLLKYGELTGTNEVTETLQFEIFPNPAREKIQVAGHVLQDYGGKVEIYDLNGRKLLEKQIPAGSETIEVAVSSLQSGIYFCKIITEKGNATNKLIIQK